VASWIEGAPELGPNQDARQGAAPDHGVPLRALRLRRALRPGGM